MPFVVTQLDSRTWKIVEDDPFKEYPFIYVRRGKGVLAVVDSGTGTENIAAFIQQHHQINHDKLPIICICTHCHFDHVGGAADLQAAGAAVAMGDRNRIYTQNPMLSMAQRVGTQVKPFKIDRWLEEGTVIDLDGVGDGDAAKKESSLSGRLVVYHMPGHTEDSICLLDAECGRVFCGDLLYPFQAVSVESPVDFRESLERLVMLPAEVAAAAGEGEGLGAGVGFGSGSGAECADSDACVAELAEILGLGVAELRSQVDAEALLSLSDNVVEQAVMLFLNDKAAAAEMCPPRPEHLASASASVSASVSASGFPLSTGLQLACGHIESALPIGTVRDALALLEAVHAGAIDPSRVEDGVGEFYGDRFAFLLPLTKL